MAQEETADAPDGTVLAELQRGYRIRDRILRPAMVIVAKNEARNEANNTNANQPFANDIGREATGG